MLTHKTFINKNIQSRKKIISRVSRNNNHIDNVKIFHVNPQFIDVSLNDIEDCLSSCTINQTHQQKQELFYSNGIDYDKVFKYYKFVKDLNNVYYNSSDNKIVNTSNDNIIARSFKNIWVCLQITIHWLKIR
jgi:hypothetical protein